MRATLQKTSLIDYPDRVAAVLFFPHCNMRCPWCHNRQLVLPREIEQETGFLELDEIFVFLEKRKTVLSGLVITGGEALYRHELGPLVLKAQEMGYKVKLDTNGMCPESLEKLLLAAPPDFIAFDLKIAPERYKELGGNGAALIKSADILRASGIDHEYRSLSLPTDYFGKADIQALAPLADQSPWYFGPFKTGNCLDEAWDEKKESVKEEAQVLVNYAIELGKNARLRGF